MQSGDLRRNFGQCVTCVVTHYPVVILLWPSPEEECESDIQYHPISEYLVHDQCDGAAVQHPLSTVFPDSNPTIAVLHIDA
ncbi:hypothetical protein TNCV_3467201 [Trichonephila clavipes]|nr:hypothetical protein TNCV_3467201 [Trichonephila clavipes]